MVCDLSPTRYDRAAAIAAAKKRIREMCIGWRYIKQLQARAKVAEHYKRVQDARIAFAKFCITGEAIYDNRNDTTTEGTK